MHCTCIYCHNWYSNVNQYDDYHNNHDQHQTSPDHNYDCLHHNNQNQYQPHEYKAEIKYCILCVLNYLVLHLYSMYHPYYKQFSMLGTLYYTY